MPVACSSSSTFWSAGRSRGTSSRMSEITGIRVPTPQPMIATRAATASTLPGAAIEKARARPPTARPREPRAAPAARRGAPARPTAARPRAVRAAVDSAPCRVRAGPAVGGGRLQQGEAREAHRERQREGDHEPEHEEEREAANHRDRREHQHGEARHRGQAGRCDHRAPPCGGLHRRSWRRGARSHRLRKAGLELDRVVDGEADQHRQDRDRGHGQRAPDQRQEAEHEAGRADRDPERQEPQRGPEDQREGDHHRRQGGGQEDEDLAGELLGEPLEHHRHAADHVARLGVRRPLLEAEARIGHGVPEEGDRLAALGLARARAAGEPRSGPSRSWGRSPRTVPSARNRRTAGRRSPTRRSSGR